MATQHPKRLDSKQIEEQETDEFKTSIRSEFICEENTLRALEATYHVQRYINRGEIGGGVVAAALAPQFLGAPLLLSVYGGFQHHKSSKRHKLVLQEIARRGLKPSDIRTIRKIYETLCAGVGAQ